jgi:tRNA (guanine37-N1)-methyltransferase
LRIDIITIFPEIFFGPLGSSVVGRARERGLIEINTVDLRGFARDERGTVDDKPYGGGPGMLMKPEPVFDAVESLRKEGSLLILTTPRGGPFTQKTARRLARESHLIIICGHYEGVDERVRAGLSPMEISIGDYVLTSGNLPAMVICDAVARLVPGVLGCESSGEDESFSDGLLEYPQYTRPPEYRGMRVPDILLSGNHGEIARWRKDISLADTAERRPDLLGKQENSTE